MRRLGSCLRIAWRTGYSRAVGVLFSSFALTNDWGLKQSFLLHPPFVFPRFLVLNEQDVCIQPRHSYNFLKL